MFPDVILINNVYLKNNVALMTPSVKYGFNFVDEFTRTKVTGDLLRRY